MFLEIIISKSLFLDRFYWITDGLLVARLKCSKSHYTKTYLHTIVLRHCVCVYFVHCWKKCGLPPPLILVSKGWIAIAHTVISTLCLLFHQNEWVGGGSAMAQSTKGKVLPRQFSLPGAVCNSVISMMDKFVKVLASWACGHDWITEVSIFFFFIVSSAWDDSFWHKNTCLFCTHCTKV